MTFSRLAVVRLWPDVEQARVDALIGVLSPKRAAYSLGIDDSQFQNATFRPPSRGRRW
ncbi:MAG: hypothetical protein IPK19_25280 [Chloroflexi bacterium]|nr:hypothetical protein [Chloroflexota bacterium]